MNEISPSAATTLRADRVEALRRQLSGALSLPGEPGYEAARTLWNAMIDKRPAVIAHCRGESDVAACLHFARQHGLPVSVKGGGHNIAGFALSDGGMTIDLSNLRDVRVDPNARRAVVDAGALLSDVDEAAAAHGLAVPLGVNSTTGVAGLTLGGGYGWLTRRYGLTIDSLSAVDIVTPSGARLRANAQEHPDLFWALRGGGGNFGVVLSFEFDLHPLPEAVTTGFIVHSGDNASEVLRALRDVSGSLPDPLTVWAVLRTAPALSFLPEQIHGAPVVILACCWSGTPANADAALETVRGIGSPLAEAIGPHPYVNWQKAFDPLTDHGARNYWKSHTFDDLGDEAIDVFVEALGRLPSPECEIFVAQLGGAPARVEPQSTAFAHRKASFMMNVHARWRAATEDQRCMAWAREIFDRTEPYASGGVYSNFMPDDETERARAAFGKSYARLSELKALYDPENLLRANVNVRPAF